MHIHGTGVAGGSFKAPDFRQQRFPGIDASGVGGERIEKVELFGGEFDFFMSDGYGAGNGIDIKVTAGQGSRRR